MNAEPCTRRCPVGIRSFRHNRFLYRQAVGFDIPMGQHTPMKYVNTKRVKCFFCVFLINSFYLFVLVPTDRIVWKIMVFHFVPRKPMEWVMFVVALEPIPKMFWTMPVSVARIPLKPWWILWRVVIEANHTPFHSISYHFFLLQICTQSLPKTQTNKWKKRPRDLCMLILTCKLC